MIRRSNTQTLHCLFCRETLSRYVRTQKQKKQEYTPTHHLYSLSKNPFKNGLDEPLAIWVTQALNASINELLNFTKVAKTKYKPIGCSFI